MDADRHDLFCELAAIDGSNRTLVGANPELILHFTRQVGSHLGNVLCRFAHGIDAMHILHFGIWIPPAEGRVIRGQVAKGERGLGFGQRVRGALLTL